MRGEKVEARKALGQLIAFSKTRYVPPYNIALVHAGLGETAEAFRRLDQACKERDVRLVFLRADSAWDPLRSDPRFTKVLNCAHQQP